MKVNELFGNSDIKVTATGKHHLGAVIGITKYKKDYVMNAVKSWV